MKIYKVVTSDELQMATRDGWTWDPVVHPAVSEHRAIQVRDDRGRQPTREENNQGIYGTIFEPTKTSFGDVLIFVVWREQEEIDRIAEAERAASAAHSEASRVERALEEQQRENKNLSEKFDLVQKVSENRRGEIASHESVRRKLEGDLAKIRGAIGDLKYKEILNGTAKS